LPPELSFMIEKIALMYDIGKIGIPDLILLKTGKLDDEERKIMNSHPQLGAKLLGDHPSMLVQMAASIALNHHEKWDGSGYPGGLKGESIPIEGRITSISDVFDALTTQRPYKKAWPIEEVISYIKQQSGIAFDPNLVDIFIDNSDHLMEIRQKYLD
jgi:response regulator RpfG family c-di-GMP phosphodiesterase